MVSPRPSGRALLTLALLLPFLSPMRATLVTVAGMVLIVVLNFLVYSQLNLVLPLAASLLMTAALFTLPSGVVVVPPVSMPTAVKALY